MVNRPRRIAAYVLVTIGAGAVAVVAPSVNASAPAGGCASSREAIVVVDTRAHTLDLCEAGRSDGQFRVRLGKNGTGKSREGDGKTPLGRYPLGEPEPSASFGTFARIGYPTAEQRKLGYTGSAVGVHGPGRGVRWLGGLVNTFDLTDGCVGIATDAEMKRVAEWSRAHRVRTIVLR